eukprot:Skav208985  [mRNA]  locus=scaffold1270:260958:263045:- [translate_table: standard]
MKCAFCNVGSRGDLQPLVALALAFRSKGWEVLLISEERSRALAEEFHLDFRAVAGDSVGIIFEEEYAEMLAKGKLMAMMQEIASETERRKKTWHEQALTDWMETTKDVQMIVSGPLTFNETYCMAEKLGIPWIPLLYGPLYPTSEFPNPFVMESNWFGWLNLLTYNFLYWALWMQQGSDVNAFRTRLGLEPLTGRRGLMSVIEEKELLVVGAFHEVFIPTQKIPDDWPPYFFFQNFFFVPRTPEESIDAKLKEFLQKCGEVPLVYLGLGSMPAPRPQELMDLANEIVSQLKVKAIVCAGWTNVSTSEGLEDEILVLKSVPHDVLLPKCKVILHHAGAGTCAAALRSGVPSVCLPVMLDQFYNSRQLMKLGVAPASIPFQSVASSQNEVIQAVKLTLEQHDMAQKAKEIAKRIEETDGTTLCVEKILQTYPVTPERQ